MELGKSCELIRTNNAYSVRYIIQKPNTSFETMEPGYHWVMHNGKKQILELDEYATDDEPVFINGAEHSRNYIESQCKYLGPVEPFKGE